MTKGGSVTFKVTPVLIASDAALAAKVTIAGESAGAISVCDHLVAPESDGLFRAAIMQSGPCQAQAALPAAERISVDYAAEKGCRETVSARACLRGLPVDRLRDGPAYVRIGANILTGPVTGTERLPVAPATAATQSRTTRVPMLIGTTADEFTLFVALSFSGFALVQLIGLG
jgi:para-nitrobenzyl esterase